MSHTTPKNLSETVARILDQLGPKLLSLREQPLVAVHKAGVGSQAAIVTEADRYADEFLRGQLSAAFPEYGFVTEEGVPDLEHDYLWVIDPIDGTSNYAHGLDMFGISVALYSRDGAGVFGVIDLPASGERIMGVAGGGVVLNGQVLTSVQPNYPEKPLVLLAPIWTDAEQAGLITRRLAQAVGHTRDHGCSSWQSYLVLSGQAELAVHFQLSIWDVAAALVIAQELGLAIGFTTEFVPSKFFQDVTQPITVVLGHQPWVERTLTSIATASQD